MLVIELDPKEAGMLHRVLASYLCDLHAEIVSTEIEDFTLVLKEEEEFILRLMRELESIKLSSTNAGEYSG